MPVICCLGVVTDLEMGASVRGLLAMYETDAILGLRVLKQAVCAAKR